MKAQKFGQMLPQVTIAVKLCSLVKISRHPLIQKILIHDVKSTNKRKTEKIEPE